MYQTRTREEWLQHCERCYEFHPGYTEALRVNKSEKLRAKVTLDFVQGYFRSGASVLDAGCQDGWYSAQMSRKGWKVTGIDPVKQWIDTAKMRYPGVNFVCGFLEDQGWKNKFDFVLCTETLEHVQDSQRDSFMTALVEAAKTGAYFFISVPLPEYGEHPTHAKIWGRREFKAYIRQYLNVVEELELEGKWNVVIGTKGIIKPITPEEMAQLMGGER